jgi:hypothetical protein
LSFLAYGSQTVMPPSRHVSGGKYAWVPGKGPGEIEIAQAPACLLAQLLPEATSAGPAAAADGEPIKEGHRHRVLLSRAGAMRFHGFGAAAIRAALREENGRCVPPLDDAEVCSLASDVARRYAPDGMAGATIRFGPAPAADGGPAPATAAEPEGPADPSGAPPAALELRPFHRMRMRPVRWLVPDFIPRGTITIFAGDGGYGKSVLTLHLAACLTRGGCCFGLSYDAPLAGRVLLLGCEDDEQNTVLPRLAAAGAALDKVASVGDLGLGPGRQPFTLFPAALATLEETISHYGNVLALIIDPVSAFIPDRLDDHQDSHVRRMLRPLAELAERTGVACVLVKHLNKSDSPNGGNLVSGSRAYVNASRAAFLVGPDPDGPEDGDDRVLVVVKRNLTTRKRGLRFRAAPLSKGEQERVLGLPQAGGLSARDQEALRGQLFRLEWLGETDATAADLARVRRGKDDDAAREGRAERAADWLVEFLKEGPRPSAEVMAAGRAAGHSRNGLFEAKKLLGARAEKTSLEGGWTWSLPGAGPRVKPTSPS